MVPAGGGGGLWAQMAGLAFGAGLPFILAAAGGAGGKNSWSAPGVGRSFLSAVVAGAADFGAGRL